MTTVLRRSLVAFASALALVAIAAVPGVGSAAFSTPVDLSAPLQDANTPQVAVGSDGATTITWARYDGNNNYIIQARTRPAGSDTFGTPVDLSESGLDAYDPQVAVGSDGATTITWSRQGGNNNYIIQARTRPAGETAFGPVANLSESVVSGRQAFRPQVAVGPDGATTITWMFSNGTNEIIQASTRPAGQTDFSDAVNLSGIYAYDPQVAVGPDGATTITWRRYDPNSIIQARTRPAGSAIFGDPVNLSASGGQDAEYPQVAVGADGATTITWTRGGIIQAVTRPAGGAFPDPADPVDLSETGQNALNPQVAVGPDGATTITWQRSNGDKTIIQARTRPAEGGAFGGVVNLSASGRNASGPQVAVGPGGATTITWQRSSGISVIIQARTRPAGSDDFSAVVNVSAVDGEADKPQVAVGPDGATTITWGRYDGDNNIIQAATSLARLSVTTDGSGAGSVTSAPVGINCGATCDAYFAIGSSVTLTATAASGSVLTGWSGGCTGTSSTCVVTLSAATSVTATFGVAPAPTPAVTDPATPVNTVTMKLLKRSVLSITTQLNLPGAGKVVQVGTTRSSTRAGERAKKAGTMIVCTARKTVAKAGKVTIICRLTAKARAARKTQSLKVRLVTTFTPTGGTAKSVTRTLVLKKTGSPAPQNVEPVTG